MRVVSVKFKGLISLVLSYLSFCGLNSGAVKKRYLARNSVGDVNAFKNKNRRRAKRVREIKSKIKTKSINVTRKNKIGKSIGKTRKNSSVLLENVGQNDVKRLHCKFENLCGKFLSYVKNHPVAFSSEMVGGITGLSFVSWWASILRLGEYFDSNNL